MIIHMAYALLTCNSVIQAIDFKKGLEMFALAADVLGELIDAVDDCEFTCPKGKWCYYSVILLHADSLASVQAIMLGPI